MTLRLFKGPASAHQGPGEEIREFSTGKAGGLLSVRTLDGGGIVVELYRTEGDVTLHADENVQVGKVGGFNPVVTAEGHRFAPWTDGHAVGFKVTQAGTGRVRYVYLNPSSESGDGQASVTLYESEVGNAAMADGALSHVDPFRE